MMRVDKECFENSIPKDIVWPIKLNRYFAWLQEIKK